MSAWRGPERHRLAEHRLDGLHEQPRPSAPRKIGDAQVEAVISRTLESLPADGTVQRIWRAFGLQPHRVETLCNY